MASLYQRFTGKINTNKSFPNPPEASHLLGQGVEGERTVENQRPRLQHQYRRHSEDEDVKPFLAQDNLTIPSLTLKLANRATIDQALAASIDLLVSAL
eukprot:superscaffoldBa00001392_g10349